MTDFYIKTDQTVAGPFTGVEVREAALAHVVLPTSGVGASADGPWTPASETGLFSDKNVPLPHPAGTNIPEFRLTGVSEAFQGTFKLRELIGFAMHQMLPSDALVQAKGQQQWMPVTNIHILHSCLQGELAPAGKRRPSSPQSQNRVDAAHQSANRWRGEKKAQPKRSSVVSLKNEPIETVSENSGSTQLEFAASSAPVDVTPQDRDQHDDAPETDPTLDDYNEQFRSSLRKGSAAPRLPKLHPRYMWAAACLIVAAVVWLAWQPSRMAREELIGDWVYLAANEGVPSFGISFRKDGSCVLFNVRGHSWTGDFQWLPTQSEVSGFTSLGPMSAKIADIQEHHLRGTVQPTDGYIKMKGSFAGTPPVISNQEIRDCFLRREGGNLSIGYLASIDWANGKKTMEVGWIPLVPAATRSDSISKLGSLDQANAKSLLTVCGVPDEARPLHPFERHHTLDPAATDDLQLIRYGNQKLLISTEGGLQAFSPATDPASSGQQASTVSHQQPADKTIGDDES